MTRESRSTGRNDSVPASAVVPVSKAKAAARGAGVFIAEPMAGRRSPRRTSQLFKFDRDYLQEYGCIAGVDEAGCGPLAGPVVAAAVVLPDACNLPLLSDGKQLSAEPKRRRSMRSFGATGDLPIQVGVVESQEIDRVNIRQAGFASMRLALSRLVVEPPKHVLVDGFRIPQGTGSSRPRSSRGTLRSAHIAAARPSSRK